MTKHIPEIANLSKDDRRRYFARLRQKTSYAKNKVAILENNRQHRLYIKNNFEVIPEPQQTIFNLATIIEKLKHVSCHEETTKKKNINLAKTIFRILEISPDDDLSNWLVDFDMVKSKINNAIDPKTKILYKVGTTKGYFEFLLVMRRHIGLPMDDELYKKYDDYNKIMKMKNLNINIEKQNSEDGNVIYFPSYIDKIKQKYGVDSKEYLIIRIYEKCTCRDNLAGLKIVDNLEQTSDKKINYLFTGETNYRIILNKYKTKSTYGILVYNLGASLTTLIKKYIIKNKLIHYLFPSRGKIDTPLKSLGDFIAKMGDFLNLKERMNINGIRHSYVSYYEEKYPNMTPERRLKFSKHMAHGTTMAAYYKRMINEHSQFEAHTQEESQF